MSTYTVRSYHQKAVDLLYAVHNSPQKEPGYFWNISVIIFPTNRNRVPDKREREDEVLILGIPAMLRDYHHTIRCFFSNIMELGWNYFFLLFTACTA